MLVIDEGVLAGCNGDTGQQDQRVVQSHLRHDCREISRCIVEHVEARADEVDVPPEEEGLSGIRDRGSVAR
jgi:hypothetical protein